MCENDILMPDHYVYVIQNAYVLKTLHSSATFMTFVKVWGNRSSQGERTNICMLHPQGEPQELPVLLKDGYVMYFLYGSMLMEVWKYPLDLPVKPNPCLNL